MNQRHTLAALATLSLTLGLTACTAPTATSPSTPLPATSGPAATTPIPPATSAPAPTTPAATPRQWPTIRGEAGGVLSVNGQQVGRDDAASTEAFLQLMGTPDETNKSATCGKMPLKNTTHRWGELKVIVLDEEDSTNEYGFSYPAGTIAGWVVDPALAEGGTSPSVSGPEGITVGTDVATLETTFTDDDWDYADREGDTFSIFAGDTTGASFALDPTGKVARMSAGYTCGVHP